MVVVFHLAVEQNSLIALVLVFVSLVFLFFILNLCLQVFNLFAHVFYLEGVLPDESALFGFYWFFFLLLRLFTTDLLVLLLLPLRFLGLQQRLLFFLNLLGKQ